MYAPRNGTIRGSGAAPASSASRSDAAPAQNTAKPAASSPRAWRRTMRRPRPAAPRSSMPATAAFVWISPPASRRSSASARATAAKSTIAVAGECSAAIPAACGSISRRPAASRRRRPGTPLAAPRRSSSSSAGSSARSSATISLPQRSYASPRASQ